MIELIKDNKITLSLMKYSSLRQLAESLVDPKEYGYFLDEIYNVGTTNSPNRILLFQKLIVAVQKKSLMGIPLADVEVKYAEGKKWYEIGKASLRIALTDKKSPEKTIEFHVGQAVRGTVNGIRNDKAATVHFQKYLNNLIKFLRNSDNLDYSIFNIVTLTKKNNTLVSKAFSAFGSQEKLIISNKNGRIWIITDEYTEFTKSQIINVELKGVLITLKLSGKEILFGGYVSGKIDQEKSKNIYKKLEA